MKCRPCIRIALLFCAAAIATGAVGQPAERESIQDSSFRRGFTLFETKPGQHVRNGELKGFDAPAKPAWGLLQWSSKFPLDPAALTNVGHDVLVCSNSAKSIRLGPGGESGADITMAVNTGVEYGVKARKAGDPWVHLLVEQQVFDSPPALEKIRAAKLHVEARLSRSRNLHQGDYTPDVHAAQFLIYFTVQNRNRMSPGYGDLVWFGIPIYDNRDRFPKKVKFQDFGGTGKFIFMPEGKTFTPQSAHDGQWIVLEKDLLPLMRDAVEMAWSRGFLKDAKQMGDYYIGGMNMGWEVPGTFDVEMQVRRLSLKLVGM